MKDIAIIGGSIAGCLAALVFDRLGYRVTVFERSSAVLYDRGAAVSIPSSLFMEMKERDLIDPDTPHITHKCMHYSFASKTEGDQTLLTVPTDIIALRWGELYQQLYKRVNSQCYHRGVAVCQLEERAENVLITLDSGTRLSVDLV